MPEVLISIVVPTFNSEQFVSMTLESILNQTYKNIEIIVVDDCSSDNTKAVVMSVAKRDPRVRCLELPENSGTPAVPRNVGIKVARGDFIAFCDSDDIWSPIKLARQIEILELTESFLCSTSCLNFNSFHPPVFTLGTSKVNAGFVRISLFSQLVKYRTPTSSLLVRRDVFDRYLFNESRWLAGREDLLWSLTVHSVFGASVKLPEPLVFYRKHNSQISAAKPKMFFKLCVVLACANLTNKKYLKLLFPFFCLTNLVFSLALRKMLRRL